MSEAEKKWDIFDKQNGYPFKSKQSREAYKAALRREIKKRRAQLQKEQAVHIKGSDWHTAIENRLRELQIFEDSLDTVEP